MKTTATILFTVALLVSGCCTRESPAPKAQLHWDSTHGRSDICEIHLAQMARQVVPVEYGTPAGRPEEIRAMNEYYEAHFPHARTNCWLGCVVGEEKTATIFVCAECQKAEKAWKENHK